jgi:hypothetical protein
VALTLAPLAGCDSSAERVAIVAHYVPACAPEAGTAPPQMELVALGDFDRSNDSVSILSSAASQRALALPEGTQGVELSTLGDQSYWGTGERDTHNQISVLLWPRDQACPLAQRSAADAGEWLFAPFDQASQLLGVPAVPAPDGAQSAGFSIDLRTAQLSELSQGLGSARRFASASELGRRLLIAGGSDPVTGRARADAELFDAATRSFQAQPLELAIARTRHAALSLPSGATLLIGGEAESGAALSSVEILSPDAARSARALELLSTPRIQPSALLLGDGRILVGGGFVWVASTRDPRAGRQAIASVEFLSFDLTDLATEPVRLEPAALDRAFVELAPGSTLAVGGCDPVLRAGECLPCGATPGCISRSVWWIDPQGSQHALEPLPVALAAAQPHLVAAAEGAPWLIANGRLARFDPWQARFVAVEDVATGSLDGLLQAPLGLGPALLVWMQQAAGTLDVFGLHATQRGRLTQDVAPLLVGSGRGVVPHRPPAAAQADDSALSYTLARGLELAGSSAVVSIADTDYADFTLDLSLAAGPAPLLRLVGRGAAAGQASSFGGLECAWPDFTPAAPDAAASAVRLRVQRSGDAVSLLWADAVAGAPTEPAPEPCRRPLPARVGIQLLGTPLGATRLTRIEVRRSLGAD